MTDIIEIFTRQEMSRKVIAYLIALGRKPCSLLCDEFDAMEQGLRFCCFEKSGKLSSCVAAIIKTMQNNPKRFSQMIRTIQSVEEKAKGVT